MLSTLAYYLYKELHEADKNLGEMKQHLGEGGFFEPTPYWDSDRSHDRTWS